jgi:lipoprotein-releasing system ATP-binding protein
MRIEARKLSMHFDDADRRIEIFKDLSFEVPSGKSLAIIGESGIGKTTLLYILGALEYPVSGTVVVGDTAYEDLRSKPALISAFRGDTLGFIFQFHHLLPEFDAVENVAMPLLIKGQSFVDARIRAEYLLGRVGLSERLGHRPGMLSGGEQQRVAVARAFAAKPGVILADEPTGNLDHKTGSEVHGMLREMQEEEGTSLVIVTHSLDLAATTDRTIELTPSGLIER